MDIKTLRGKMKWYRILFLCFAVLSLVGLIAVLIAGGDTHTEYVMVPLIIAAIFRSMYQETEKTVKNLEKKMNQK